jgi:hypothetical protein
MVELPPPEPYRPDSSRWPIVGLILVLAVGSLGYRTLVLHKLEQTSALFIGLPAVLALVLALTPQTKSVTGMILKIMTLLLLLSGIVLGEGFICIVMAAPLFYGIGLIVGLSMDAAERRRRRREGAWMGLLVLLPLVPASLEGVRPEWSFSRDETVFAERIVAAAAGEVEKSLAETPRFERRLPFYLRLKFPRPVAASGSGLEKGSRRVVHFAGGEGKPGDLVLSVADRGPGWVRFDVVSDSSKIAHWLDWRQADVRWSPAGDNATRVRWTVRYTRRLDPAWYFGPWERYAVRLAAGYLVETVSTPRGVETSAASSPAVR